MSNPREPFLYKKETPGRPPYPSKPPHAARPPPQPVALVSVRAQQHTHRLNHRFPLIYPSKSSHFLLCCAPCSFPQSLQRNLQEGQQNNGNLQRRLDCPRSTTSSAPQIGSMSPGDLSIQISSFFSMLCPV